MDTKQIEFWRGEFGKEYTDRNSYDPTSWDKFYMDNWGVTKLQMNEECLAGLPKDIKILEVGCNIGLQLAGLQRMGFRNLYGLELQEYAVDKARKSTTGINVIQGSGFDIPFKDEWFDLVCTNGVLIHISPDDYSKIMEQMVRCSKRYIMGFEYYAAHVTEIKYRNHDGFLWKANFAAEFLSRFPELKLVYNKLYPYINQQEANNADCVYLLEKQL